MFEKFFNRDYFIKEYHEFRKLMTNKTFMQNPEARDNALRGFTTVYMMTENLTEADRNTFIATVDEFERRSVMIDMQPLRELLKK